ncbi:hypothetical protein AAKU55_005780 [Oxalobacteraceae bacterium GrIS 1.11]
MESIETDLISASVGDKYELPGYWFNSSGIQALLTMRQLLSSLGPSLLTAQVESPVAKMRLLLGGENVSIDAFEKRTRIQRLNACAYEPAHFMPVNDER